MFGAYQHINAEDKNKLIVDILSNEALKTSEIEGEYLNRESLQSSIRRNFGLDNHNFKIPPAERGISEMMVDLYHHFSEPLTHTILFNWHKMLTNGRQDLIDIGRYRTHAEPMQVVSGYIDNPKVHFEAPPSSTVFAEMEHFLLWFNKTAPDGKEPLPALTRAAIAHLYFVCLHPFEDGNGRIARALAEKVIAQCVKQPTLIALAQTIQKHRKAYYSALEHNNKTTEISDWITYFAQTILDAQAYTLNLIEILIKKAKFYERYREQLNERQTKVIQRMFMEKPDGFKVGLSAENYIRISGTSRATATRDLQNLVHIGALIKTGEKKSTRYNLPLS
jgi:Fic family protein